MKLPDFPEIVDYRKLDPAIGVGLPLQIVVVVVGRLPEVELNLEFCSLSDDLIWKFVNAFRIELGVVPCELVKLFLVVQHLVSHGPFRKLLDIDIENIFSCSAVDATNFIFDDLNVVESSGYEVCCKIHGCGHENLLFRVLHKHVCDNACKYFGLTSSRRALY